MISFAPIVFGGPVLKKNYSIYLKGLINLLVLAGAWFVLAPAQVGGQFIYVLVSGNSMEPLLQRGDLAILRKTYAYDVGDIVVYRHPSLGPVIHRIISVSEGRYLLQGDNNAWTDSYLPSDNDVDGELLFFFPKVGKVILGFRTPIGAAILTGVIGVFLFWPFSPQLDEFEQVESLSHGLETVE